MVSEVMNLQKTLLIGGLVLILTGTLLGATYAGMYITKVKISQQKSIENAVQIASESPSYAKKEARQFMENQLLDVRTSNFHSHMTLIGLVALALSYFIRRMRLSDNLKFFTIIMLLGSGFIMPVGIIMENWLLKPGSYIALTGGLMFLISMTIFLIGSIRSREWT